MKNEKSAKDASEKTAVERWENEGGEVLNVPEVQTDVPRGFNQQNHFAVSRKNIERRRINFGE